MLLSPRLLQQDLNLLSEAWQQLLQYHSSDVVVFFKLWYFISRIPIWRRDPKCKAHHKKQTGLQDRVQGELLLLRRPLSLVLQPYADLIRGAVVFGYASIRGNRHGFIKLPGIRSSMFETYCGFVPIFFPILLSSLCQFSSVAVFLCLRQNNDVLFRFL